MYNFSPGEVPQSVIDGVTRLATSSHEATNHITEIILKYLTGVGGVNKEVMAEAVAEFASMAGMDIGQAQGLAKVLLNILKASYRAGLTPAQVEADFQKLTGSVEATKLIVSLWSQYVHRSDSATDLTTGADTGQPEASADTGQPEAKPAIKPKPQPVAATADISSAAGIRTEAIPSETPPADGDRPSEAPLSSLDDVLEEAGVRAFDELQDIQWRFGVTAASSDPSLVGRTFVRLALHVQTPEGRAAVRNVQLTVGQFYSLLHQLEKARAVSRFM